MKHLMELLSDGRARTISMLAAEMNTNEKDILRQIEYLEHRGVIRRVMHTGDGCAGCGGCGSGDGKNTCMHCAPEGGFQNMGQMWEVV